MAGDPLDNLTDALVEDTLAASDEEIMAEAVEDGIDAAAVAEQGRRIFQRVVEERGMDTDPAIEAAARAQRRVGMTHSLGLLASVAMRLDHSIFIGPSFLEPADEYVGRLLRTIAAAGYALAAGNPQAAEEEACDGFWRPELEAEYAAKLHDALRRAYLAAQPGDRTAEEMREGIGDANG